MTHTHYTTKSILTGLVVALVGGCATTPPAEVKFKKLVLWDDFYTEAVAVADVNKDGIKDIMAGARWFEGPDWKPHNIWQHAKFDYTKGYSDSYLNYARDINDDGWVDLIVFDYPGKEVHWYENPAGEEVHWKKHLIDSTAANESPMLVDVNGDGQTALVFSDKKRGLMAAYTPVVEHGELNWVETPISEPGSNYPGMFGHGLGWGDVNGDGRNDVLFKGGWWEAPAKVTGAAWTFHEAKLGEDCAQMITWDFDGDGDSDVLSSSAHRYGVWWHEQVKTADGSSDFVTHTIDSTFSESHSIVLTDVNNDGSPDFITGKRFYSHQGRGPGGQETPVLYWFELSKGKTGGPEWIRHTIDTDSGVGIQFVAEDMNGDGKVDIIIGNKKGVFYFEQL